MRMLLILMLVMLFVSLSFKVFIGCFRCCVCVEGYFLWVYFFPFPDLVSVFVTFVLFCLYFTSPWIQRKRGVAIVNARLSNSLLSNWNCLFVLRLSLIRLRKILWPSFVIATVKPLLERRRMIKSQQFDYRPHDLIFVLDNFHSTDQQDRLRVWCVGGGDRHCSRRNSIELSDQNIGYARNQ